MRLQTLRVARGLGFLFATLSAIYGVQGAHAQVPVEQYRASEVVSDGFALSRPIDVGHLKLGAQLHLDYARKPLVFEREQGNSDSVVGAVVKNQLVGQLGLALGLFDRMILFAGLPVSLIMNGNSVAGQPAADGTALGDAVLGARLRLVGDFDSLFALALQLSGTLPTAEWADSGQNYSGDRIPSVHPEVLGELRLGAVRLTANVGVRIRREGKFSGVNINDELTYGLGASMRLTQWLRGYVEGFGATTVQDFGKRESTPLEALLGLKVPSCSGWVAGAGAGAGVTHGFGSPNYRLIAMLGYGVPDRICHKNAAPGDRDGDGLLDNVDQCPDDPEDFDEFEDENGCPDPDNDKDGILDVNDRCPLEPENMNGVDDTDGCPETPIVDSDGDGLLDNVDECKDEPEDKDGFKDEDGCPDPDNDEDAVLDEDDKCPLTKGVKENDGCPALVRMEGDKLVILQRIEFETNKDVILPESYPILQDVLAVLTSHASLRVRVEGHTDSQGKDAPNLDLSQRRAASVVRWLVEKGVAESRLEPQGFGETKPIADNKTKEGRKTNRRVEFHIINPGEGNSSTQLRVKE